MEPAAVGRYIETSMNATEPSGDIRRVGVVSTGRADAGIYRPLLTALAGTGLYDVLCFAGGTHLENEFGRTLDDLAGLQGVELIAVQHFVPGDEPAQVAATAGRAVEAFSQAFARTSPDLIFVLGDRTEMLAAALAAVIHRIPIAHLHGGEITEGAYDNQCRHAITKLAHLHFAAMLPCAERIVSMGEAAWRVRTVGALALDALRDFRPQPRSDLLAGLGLDPSVPMAVVAYHPETLAAEAPAEQVAELLAATESMEAGLLLIRPNADVGHRAISKAVDSFAASRPNAVVVRSLSQGRYWSCLSHALLLVGNSSAGILEAASFRLPVVNVGDRQRGRCRASNVLDVRCRRDDIRDGIRKAMEPAFRQSLQNLANPYGDGRAAERILAVLLELPPRQVLLTKR